MTTLYLPNLREGYLTLCEYVLDKGERAVPRGLPTRELTGITIEIDDLHNAVPVGIGRGLNLAIGATETVHLLAGLSDAYQLVNVTSRFKEFMNGHRLLGAYGPRAHRQWDGVIERLVADPWTRQATVSIWHPTELEVVNQRDVPCTVALHFLVRHGQLLMSTWMRSNDLWLGVPYDFMVFTRVQHALAWALGLEVGTYTHTASSLHLYERDLEKAEQLELVSSYDPVPWFVGDLQDTKPGPRTVEQAQVRWHKVQAWAKACVTDSSTRDRLRDDSMRWYYDQLHDVRSGNLLCSDCRYVLPFDQFYPSSLPRQRQGVCKSCLSVRGLKGGAVRKLRHHERRCASYGLTVAQFNELLEQQRHLCAICKREPSNGRWKDFVIDHDHVTGRVRGLLCSNCNHGLGMFGDDVERIAQAERYLRGGT